MRNIFCSFIVLFSLCLPSSGFAQVIKQQMEWTPVAGRALSIAVARDGGMFSLDENHVAHKLVLSPKKRWFSLKEKFSELFAHPKVNGVWALAETGGQAYRFNRVWWEPKGKVALSHISVTSSGKIMALSSDNDLLQWNESKDQWIEKDTDLTVKLRLLSAETPKSFWGISNSNQLVKYTNGSFQTLDVNGLENVIYDQEGQQLYFQTSAGVLGFYDPIKGEAIVLDGMVDARLKAIGKEGRIWIVNKTNQIFYGTKKLPTDLVKLDQVPTIKAEEPEPQAGEDKASDGKSPEEGDESEAEKKEQEFNLKLAKVRGTAQELAIGQDGRVFAALNNGSMGLWNNAKNQFFAFPGNASRLAIGVDGEIWAVTKSGGFFFFDGREWKATSFRNAMDLFLAPDGVVWVSDSKENIYSYNRKTKRFKRSRLKGIRFTFDSAGAFWSVRDNGDIFKCVESRCTRLPGSASDIAVGESGLVLMIDKSNNLYRYLADQNRWDIVQKGVMAVAIGPNEKPWLINNKGEIFTSAFFDRDESKDLQIAATAQKIIDRKARLPSVAATGSSDTASLFTFSKNMKFDTLTFEGSATPRILVVGRDNAAYALSSDQATIWKFNSSQNKFKEYTDLPRAAGTTVRRLAVDLDGNAWFVYTDGQIWRPNGTDKYKQITSFTTAGFIDINYEGKVIMADTSGTLYDYNEAKDKFETFDDQDGYTSGDLSVDPDGHPWIYNTGGYLMEFTGKKFEFRPENKSQKLDQVGIGGDGSVYISEELGGSGRLLKWNFSNESFDSISLPSGVKALWVDVGPDGRPWFISTANKFYRAK